MAIRCLRRTDYREMPWKNGRGVTLQLAIEPPDAPFPAGPYTWRLSSAPVVEAGPFSQFPGMRRLLTIVDGEGMLLNGTVLNRGDVADFAGDVPTHARLVRGPVRDLGLIFDPQRIVAELEIHELGQSPHVVSQTTGLLLIVHLGHDASIEVESEPHTFIQLAHLDMLHVACPAKLTVTVPPRTIDTTALAFLWATLCPWWGASSRPPGRLAALRRRFLAACGVSGACDSGARPKRIAIIRMRPIG